MLNELDLPTHQMVSDVGFIQGSQIVARLESLGYKCEQKGFLRGISGVTHVFDIVVRRNAARIVIELLLPGNDDQNIVRAISFRTKAYDCSPDLSVLVCPSRASAELRELSDFYRFSMIESSDTNIICENLSNLLVKYL